MTNNEQSIALYSPPGGTDTHLIQDAGQGRYSFVFAPFQQSEKHRLITLQADEIQSNPDLSQLEVVLPDKPELLIASQQEHEAWVSQIISAIKDKRLNKVVAARLGWYPLSQPLDVIAYYQELVNTYPNAFCYLFSHPGAGVWIGATPETLLRKENGLYHTMALAGTQSADGRSAEQAQWGQKEQDEQQIVTDYILDIIRPYADELNTHGPYTSQAGNLFHLRTDISFSLKDERQLPNILAALHPTPAVAGMPKEAAISFIQQHEKLDRAYYTGYLGTPSAFFVNLRCMQVFKQGLALYLGGGIVADSNPKAEWQETEAKSRTLLNVLAKIRDFSSR